MNRIMSSLGDEVSEFFIASDFNVQIGDNRANHEIANDLLRERAVRVWGTDPDGGYGYWCEVEGENAYADTKTALLINIEPIRKDTAEDLLRELRELDKAAARFVGQEGPDMLEGVLSIIERARKLLSEK